MSKLGMFQHFLHNKDKIIKYIWKITLVIKRYFQMRKKIIKSVIKFMSKLDNNQIKSIYIFYYNYNTN